MDDWRVLLAVLFLAGALWAGLSMARQQGERALLHREHMLATRASVAIARAQPANVPQTYSPHVQITQAAERAALPGPAPVIDLPPLALPGVTTLDQLLAEGWRPRPDHILLGLGPGGTRVEVPADDKLCHVLTVGRTGYGKSSFNRLLLPQLIACGFDVYLLDLDYTPVDPKNGEEWWPLAQRTKPGDALYEIADIRAAIKDARQEVDRRHVVRRQVRAEYAAPPWNRRFYAIEEAPELASQYPEFMDDAAHILRRGRRVDVYLLLITQSGLIKVIGGNSGDRAMFGTVAYVGGEPTSARAILDEKVPEPAGKGLARLRCYGVPTSIETRIPYGTNSGIRTLLATQSATAVATNGYSGGYTAAENGYTVATDNVIDLTARVAKVVPDVANVAISADAARALDLFRAGKSMADVVLELRGIASNQGGKYQAALTEVQDLVRQAINVRGA